MQRHTPRPLDNDVTIIEHGMQDLCEGTDISSRYCALCNVQYMYLTITAYKIKLEKCNCRIKILCNASKFKQATHRSHHQEQMEYYDNPRGV